MLPIAISVGVLASLLILYTLYRVGKSSWDPPSWEEQQDEQALTQLPPTFVFLFRH